MKITRYASTIVISNVKWLPFNFDALALKPFVLLRGANLDTRLFDHEMVHIRQQQRLGLFRYLWKYWTEPRFRYLVEFAAYAEGSKMSPSAAEAMAKKYEHLKWMWR